MDKSGDNLSSKTGNNNTASLFLMALLLICITAGLVRGIKMEPRNPKRLKSSVSRSLQGAT